MKEELIKILSGIDGFGPDAKPDDLSTDRGCSTLPSRIPRSDRNADNVKNFIINKMHYHDKKKYPNPPWQYERLTCGKDPHKQTIIHVTHNPSPADPPPAEIMATQEAHALALRKLSIIGGLITGLEADGFLAISDPRAKQWLIDKLYQMAEEVRADKLEGIKPENTIAGFCGELSGIIHQSGVSTLPESAIAEHLKYDKGAELWFIAEYNRNQTVVFESKSADSTPEYQIDVPNLLTEAQLKDIERILKDDNPPKWFTKRPAWEQDWLKNHAGVLAWDFKAAGHMHTPGAPNARTNYYYRGDEQISRSMKSAILNPYKINNETERKRITKQNVRQMIDVMRDTLEAEAKDHPLPARVPPLQKLIFIQSLVSNALGHPETKMANEELEAIGEVALEPSNKNAGIKIIATNTPVNFTRHLLNSFSKRPTTSSNNEIGELITYAHHFLGPRPWNNDTALIQAALHNLEEMQRTGPKKDDRNFHLMRAATATILVEAMGGISLSHCKSGKDRTGLLENTQLTLLKCWNESGNPPRLPSYYDNTEERRHYVRTFVGLFLGRKICETASMSAPGSFGIKDKHKPSVGILCEDIRETLGATYQSHRKLAKLNKPEAGYFAPEEKFDYSSEKIKGIRSLLPWQAELTLEQKQPVYIHESISCRSMTDLFAEPLDLTISKKFNDASKLEFLIENSRSFSVVSESKIEQLAKRMVQEFLAHSPRPQDGIEIFGALDPLLSRKIEAYCKVMDIPCANNNTKGAEARATDNDCDQMRRFLNIPAQEPDNIRPPSPSLGP